ncbi:replication-relaxation family protein [Bdellovibrio svalbardensis]|uniref:Replication-relaxation family protein n=1 Tax=Bdellovibrio svalbardensis TaxID=2972972 RepID=A0ABT6DJN2_9BACT|nr:replication-relaxation family protein [Bdellovibrio svalbardensis]MDG0816425.1 replication-relaxation family protein [Bdellovibrio svalbardensis]
MTKTYAFPKREPQLPLEKLLSMNELEITKYVLEMRYLTLGQIITRFYDEGRVEESVRKLLNLQILKCKDETLNEQSLFLATLKGFELVQAEWKDKKIPQVTKSVMPGRLNHDLLLNDLRIRFEQLNYLKQWASEQSLKEVPLFLREFQNMPDACCKKKNDKSYFLELEVAMKNAKAYRDRIETYLKVLQHPDMKGAGIEGVIFFCTDDKVVEVIKKQIPKEAKGISVMPYYKYFANKDEEPRSVTVH